MSTFVGKRPESQPAAEVQKADAPKAQQSAGSAEKTRAELVEEAESLGIKVPKTANKAQIQKLIDEAPVM